MAPREKRRSWLARQRGHPCGNVAVGSGAWDQPRRSADRVMSVDRSLQLKLERAPAIACYFESVPNGYDRRVERALEVLREAAPESLSFGELRSLGIDKPAQVVYELELAGYAIERRGRDVRLASDGT